MIYKKVIKPLFFQFDPEGVHEFVAGCLEIGGSWGVLGLFEWMFKVDDAVLGANLAGLQFKNPVGIGAGFDKKGKMISAIESFGFGFMEVGTITPVGQVGNDKQRLFRLPLDNAIINRMGFNNDGVEKLKMKLEKKTWKFPVGGNIGKNKVTPNEEANNDYLKCFEALFEKVDFFVVNVSSPNTPGLRELQDKEPLRQLLKALQEKNKVLSGSGVLKPMFLKIAPDLTEGQLDDVVDLILEVGLTGCVATNTTVSRDGLRTAAAEVEKIGMGGLSGAPIKKKSLEIVRYLYKKSGGKFLIIGVGGVENADDALAMIKAGASLIELYTGFIYEGPMVAKKINEGIVAECRKLGVKNYLELVGKA